MRRGAAVLGAAMAIGCTSDKGGTGSDSDTTGTAGTSSESPTGGATECGAAGSVVADVRVTWGIPVEPCDGESCVTMRDPTCTVSAIAGDAPIELTLACSHAGLGMATDVVTIDLQPGGALDLAVGGAVSLRYRSASHFEVGGETSLRITDDSGLVLGAARGALSGGFSGSPDWGSNLFAAAVSPLSGSVANAGCADDEARNAVTLARDDASVSVQAGDSGLLTADASWLVVVETASRAPTPDYDEEQLDVAVMRVAP